MRLGDLDALREDWLENGENEYVYDTNSFLASIDEQPTINPETLPVVQELRQKVHAFMTNGDRIRSMNEMRPIDANQFEAFSITPPDGYSDEQLEAYHAGATLVLEKIDAAQTINPEELPVVLNLRAALANVTAQRNAAARDCAYAIRNTGFGCCYCLYGKKTKYGARVDYECTYEGRNKHGCMPKWRGRDW